MPLTTKEGWGNMSMERKASVLIVDDNTSQCKTLSLILQHKGFDATTANDGPEAIRMVTKRPFDMIFMDIKMPLMDGVETYKQIKKVRSDAVVVMMTAFAVEDLVQQALEAGAYGIVYKPLDIEKIISMVEDTRRIEKGMLVLVVDDDDGTRITLRTILKKKGFKVCIAASGEEAIIKTQKKDYDIIFIDMKLPVLNGLETYLAIHEISPRAVAIMMTAYHQEMADLVNEALNNDAYTCFYKPFDIEELLKLMNEIWDKKQNA
ncbi:MAG: response regulator [Anaerolineales bacterium]|nr:response regulator [Anaerolineales bacterium]